MNNEQKILFKEICRVLRIAIMGSEVGPPLFESMAILGKEECLKRINIAIQILEDNDNE